MDSPQISTWHSRIDLVTSAVREVCNSLSSDELNLHPGPGEWSIAQVIEHLIAVSTSYHPIFEEVLSGKYKSPWTSRLPFLHKWLGNMILNSVKPDNKRKSRTFPIWQPEHGNIDISVVEDFVESQSKLKTYVSNLGSKDIIINSPASTNIVYSIHDAFEIIVAHEERHLGQINRIVRHLKAHT